MHHNVFYKCRDVFLKNKFCFQEKKKIHSKGFLPIYDEFYFFFQLTKYPVSLYSCVHVNPCDFYIHTWAQGQSKSYSVDRVLAGDIMGNGKLWQPSGCAKFEYAIYCF